jgi:hypothetical protein
MYDVLRNSYSHRDNGGNVEDNTAVRSVTLRHLSLSAMTEAIRNETTRLLNQYVAERPAEEVYDENYDIRSELLSEAYAQAFESVMAQTDSCMREDTMDLELEFGLKGWTIQPNEALVNAICGK